MLRLSLLAIGLFFSVHALAGNPQVKMRTNLGEIVFELFPDKAPKTVANFLNYVSIGHYNGTLFHRTIDKFIIQGGGFTPDYQYKAPLDPIQNEAANGLKNEPGMLAMSRGNDPDSATAQFFINLDNNKFLNHIRPHPDYFGFCVFGKVVKGLDIAQKIGAQPTDNKGGLFTAVPVEPVLIEEITLAEATIDEPTITKKTSKKSRKKTPQSKKERKNG